MNILHLTLKRQWFDMIASGEKKEEYRELKPYWAKRLVTLINYELGFKQLNASLKFQQFDIIRFRHGYAKDAPTMDVECKGIRIGIGRKEWGCTDECFILSLGEVLQMSNFVLNAEECDASKAS